MKHNEPLFSKALNVASRTFNDLDSLSDGSLHPPKKQRGTGVGRKSKVS